MADCFEMTDDKTAVLEWAETSPHDQAKVSLIMDTAAELILRHRAETRLQTGAMQRAFSVECVDRLGTLLAALGIAARGLLTEREAIRQLAITCAGGHPWDGTLDDLEEDDYDNLERLVDLALGKKRESGNEL